MAELSPADRHKSHDMGLHAEQLAGRTQQVFFSPEEGDNYTYPEGFDVDFTKKATIDAAEMEGPAVNLRIRELLGEGYGHIVVQNPLAKHSLGVGILNRLKLDFEGSLGYFGCGLIDGPNVHIKGRVGWSCAENMMAGVVVIDKNAGSTFGAALRGGDLVCKGDVGSRTGIDMKGGTILIGGRAGAFTGFMMQRDASSSSATPAPTSAIRSMTARSSSAAPSPPSASMPCPARSPMSRRAGSSESSRPTG